MHSVGYDLSNFNEVVSSDSPGQAYRWRHGATDEFHAGQAPDRRLIWAKSLLCGSDLVEVLESRKVAAVFLVLLTQNGG